MSFYYNTETKDSHGGVIVVGPYESREAAEAKADGLNVVEGPDLDVPDLCEACATTHPRLPMSEEAERVYDALFPDVLEWRENDDCGMGELMRSVAETAARALVPCRPGACRSTGQFNADCGCAD